MKKTLKFLVAALCMVATIALTGCKKEDNEPAAHLDDNQIEINGTVYNLTAELGVRTNGGTPEAYYVQGRSGYYSCDLAVDLGAGLVGITINLGDPTGTVGNNQFSLMLPNHQLEASGGHCSSVVNNGDWQDNFNCIKEGTFKTSHSSTEFTLALECTCTDGTTYAAKLRVPESAIHYW